MTKVELLSKLNRSIINLKMNGRKYSPEILLGLGIAGAITGTVLACIATSKLPEIKTEKEDELEDMHKSFETSDQPHSEEDLKKATTKIYVKTGLRYAAAFTPAVLTTTASIACLISGNTILRRRLMGAAAAYALVSESFSKYRDRVSERFGDEVEKELRYNITKQDVTKTVVNAKGKKKEKIESIKAMDPNDLSCYAKIYDDGNIGWTKDPEANLKFLLCQQNAANKRLKHDGFLFLNDVYEMLGFLRTPAGQLVGWVYDEKCPIGDNFVDFGIFNVNNQKKRDFVNGYERSIILDFNVDGSILKFL